MAIVARLGRLNLLDRTRHFITDDPMPDFGTVGEIKLRLHITGASAREAHAHYQDVLSELMEAQRGSSRTEDQWVEFEWDWDSGGSTFYSIERGEAPPAELFVNTRHFQVDVLLTVLPYPHGAAETFTVAATLTNRDLRFKIGGVKGTRPAPVHLEIADSSPSGVVNKVLLTRMAKRFIADVDDYTPWVALDTLGGTDVPDTDAFDGVSHQTRTTNSLVPVTLGRVEMPAGALQAGVRDLLARVRDSATALAAPTSYVWTVAEPPSTSTTAYVTPTVRQTWSARFTSGAAGNIGGPATVNGNLQLLFVERQGGTTFNAPSGFSLLASASTTTPVGNELAIFLYWRRAAPNTTNIALTWATAASAGDPITVRMVEVVADTVVGADAEVTAASAGGNLVKPTALPATLFPNELEVVFAAWDSTATASETDIWFGGYSEAASGNAQAVASAVYANAGTTPRVPGVRLTVAPVTMGWASVELLGFQSVTTTPTQPTPGSLPAGTYTPRIQASDTNGRLSAVAVGAARTLTLAGGTMAMTWVAPAGNIASYRVSYLLDGVGYAFDTPDNSTSYTMTSQDGHERIDALPVAGDDPSPARLQLYVGTAGTPAGQMVGLREIVLSGANTWSLVELGNGEELPPVARRYDGQQPAWAVEARIRSGNGLNATVDMDALWLPPHAAPWLVLEYPDLSLATAVRWLVEPVRRGGMVQAYLLEALPGTDEAGMVVTDGELTLMPGDNIVTGVLLQEDGLLSWDAEVDLTGWYLPMYDWTRGD